MASQEKIIRDYSDGYSVKDEIVTNLVPAYFSDIDASLRTVGMVGYTSEQMANISEDVFNTSSVLFRESFPNRAQLSESIFSHAAIFQIEEDFANPAECHFLVVFDENNIIENMLLKAEAGDPDAYDKDTGIYHFYVGRDTVIYVEDIPFCFDYPIRINAVKRSTEKGDEYLFTAKYLMDDIYRNSISGIHNPNIKVRRSDNGYLALDISCHQCIRDYHPEYIVSNNVVNYPTLDIQFTGILGGFDVLYKHPEDEEYAYSLDKLLIYSQPLSTPFCYYQMIGTNTLRITFNTKDNFYKPEFNAEVNIILYITKGKDGNFPVYTGTSISMLPDTESYTYTNKFLVAAKPLSASANGKEYMSLEALQSLAVEGYRTAMAITTENDLKTYFSNYKYRFGNSDVLFIRRRDDVYERLWTAYTIIRDGDYIYNTNTLNLKMNLSDMKNPEKDVYMLDPGYLFTANTANGYAEIFRDPEKYAMYLEEYATAVEDGEIPFINDPVDKNDIPAYLDRPASFAEYKARHNLDDKVMVFDIIPEDYKIFDDPSENKFLLVNPFLIRFKKNPNLMSAYLTAISQSYLLDFDVNGDNENSFIHFIIYSISVKREFAKEKKYTMQLMVGPSINVNDEETPIIQHEYDEYGEDLGYVLNDKYRADENDLRIFVAFNNNGGPSCYVEMYPIAYDEVTRNFTFEGTFYTDDHITSANKLRLLERKEYRYQKGSEDYGKYYMVQPDDRTMYDEYDENDVRIAADIPVDIITQMHNDGILYAWSNVVNMSSSSDILVPMEAVECDVYTLYQRHYDNETGELVINDPNAANNILTQFEYGDDLLTYISTNHYITSTYPITLIKSLDGVRMMLQYEDYTESRVVKDDDGEDKTVFTHDIFDVDVTSIPFMRWSIYNNKTRLSNFFDTFYNEYSFLNNIIEDRLRQATALDVKFYNTYGRSKNFYIGEDTEVINTVNIMMEFDVWFIPGTELIPSIYQIKRFIKSDVETINEIGQNNTFVSNLMRKIETNFDFVDHIRFVKINDYPSNYQAVKNFTADLETLTVEERRNYVPEFLVVDLDDIVINGYYADDNGQYVGY